MTNQYSGECESLRRIELALDTTIEQLREKKKALADRKAVIPREISSLELDLSSIASDIGLALTDIVAAAKSRRLREILIGFGQAAHAVAQVVTEVDDHLARISALRAELRAIEPERIAIAYEITQKTRERQGVIDRQYDLNCPKRPC
ncbi:hypothetical protein [Martelella radicis]|uniref:ActR/RegA family two-component response regulator n=1 Tax=Martelella radicis TaxID=1397476 RepID=A0A7W6KIX8_9HYPH|nr:hypothetical protein [Martelella radicis]MBB4122178.1 ActR/RegA family two-component response regulator [Martelella radicis]